MDCLHEVLQQPLGYEIATRFLAYGAIPP